MSHPERTPQERRQARCFHRVISGLEKGGSLRLVTLTSSDQALNPIQQDFRRLIMRLRRRRLLQDYLKVIEIKNPYREHIHMCFRGSYIEQAFLSNLWQHLHQSPVVDIRKVKAGKRNKRGVANYLAKYMSKEMYRRYSWSWGWVYKGFVKVWKDSLRIFRAIQGHFLEAIPFYHFLDLWRLHLRSRSPPQGFLHFLTLKLRQVVKFHP